MIVVLILHNSGIVSIVLQKETPILTGTSGNRGVASGSQTYQS